MRIRRAGLSDVPGMLALKRALTFDGSTAGGFLLGTDAEGYRQRVADGEVWVLDDARIVGLAIVLPDGPFRCSDLWERRADVRWEEDVEALAAGTLAYYDQLGVARGPYRRWGAALALTATLRVMETADQLVTATVQAPVCNLAAVPYIPRLGGRRVGRIDEVYPDFGPLVSDIWAIGRDGYDARLHAPVGLAERWLVDVAREAVG
ncbi:MAG: hypothetical protein KC656_28955 [Myxococcales bacterium]|nr:hypothetical protein [Myxococcales bacterium]